MAKTGDYALKGLTLAGLVAATALLQPSPAKATPGPTSVEVVNPVGSPVPVAAQGTTTVAGAVTVANTVGIKDTNGAGAGGLTLAMPITVTPGILGASNPYTVPSGKRLVIENVGATVEPPSGGQVLFRIAISTAGGTLEIVPIPCSTSYQDATGSVYVCSQLTRAYADAGANVFLEIVSSVPFTATETILEGVSLSGYLVDVP
jgi:hypothetical protein